jgi:hypothetical protein
MKGERRSSLMGVCVPSTDHPGLKPGMVSYVSANQMYGASVSFSLSSRIFLMVCRSNIGLGYLSRVSHVDSVPLLGIRQLLRGP